MLHGVEVGLLLFFEELGDLLNGFRLAGISWFTFYLVVKHGRLLFFVVK